VFLKRHYRAVRDAEGLTEEHRFLRHLIANGSAVPRVFGNSAGETAIERGAWTYEVHEALDGIDLYGDALSWTPFRTIAHAHSAGRALARMHRASEGFDAKPRKVQPLVASFTIFSSPDAGAELEHYLAARPALAEHPHVRRCCDEALESLAPFHGKLRPLLPALRPLWTHNDLHASNLLWSESGSNAQAMGMIDFGLADRTCAVHDLAQAIERNIVEWLAPVQGLESAMISAKNVPIHLDHLTALLEGYESVRTLSDEEVAALAPMTALCHAEFALSETDYFLGVLHSQEKASMACDGWLVGHARWFRSEDGKRLLDAIEEWASMRSKQVPRVKQA
jgi:Ser/Thr protein kinase RdoA (MazF antagonist)